MKIAICDDDKDELLRISSILDTYIEERNAPIDYKTFNSATELLSTTKSGAYDLYLLDIIMPMLNGIDTAREIRSVDKVAQIAFLTSSPEFAVESYSVKACNYILKPVSREKLFFALDDIMQSVMEENQPSMVVKSSEGMVKILLSQLAHVEALDRRVIYYLSSGKMIECSSPFSKVCEELLGHGAFIQLHRSYLVNMHYIKNIKNTEIVLQTNVTVPIAKRRTAEIKERYLAFQMEGE